MIHAPPSDPHLDDGVVVGLLDGQADPTQRARAEAHLAACSFCAERLDTLGRRSLTLSALLIRGDFPVPAIPATIAPMDELAARRATRSAPALSWLRAAAVIAVLALGALASSPLRAWMRDLLAGAGGSTAVVATKPSGRTPLTEAPQASARIQFTPSEEVLSVRIAASQASGSLVLSAAPGTTAWAEVRAPVGSASVELLVLPTALRIANRAGSTADYHVAIPASVRRVRVLVAGAQTATVEAGEVATGRRIPLDR